MGNKHIIGLLIISYIISVVFTYYVFITHPFTSFTGTQGVTRFSYVPTFLNESVLFYLDSLVDLSSQGKYPGTSKTRQGRRGLIPVWSQRTAILHYNRRVVDNSTRWITLSMGVVSNARNLVSNKKRTRSVWKEANPIKFSEMEMYLPKTWSDTKSFEEDAEQKNTYVYKPVLGSGGNGIVFKRGGEMVSSLREKESRGDKSSWVVQEFIQPYLHNNRKTHMRCITLVIIQPDGTREFFMYDKMRIFTAAEEFDEDRLLQGGDNSFMLLTNMHQNRVYFEEDPSNKRKKFSPSSCIFDAETYMEPSLYESTYSSTKRMHSIIYSIIGDLILCEPTGVSVYDDACFHMMASDIAVDGEGNPYFLEMNNAMGYNAWTSDEISSFYGGASGLVKGTVSPYKSGDTSMWNVL